MKLGAITAKAFRKAEEGIYDTLLAIFNRSESDGVTTHLAALKVAEKRMNDIAKLKNIYYLKNVMFKRGNKHPRRTETMRFRSFVRLPIF